MTEIEKIAYAKSFIDKLANGVNPIDNSTIPDGDVVNNVRLSRCFFYVSDILRQIIDNGGINSTYQVIDNQSEIKGSVSDNINIQANKIEVLAENKSQSERNKVINITSEKNCQNCKFARSGECFPKKEICMDYEKAFDVPQEEKSAWPEMGDASYLKFKRRHR